MPSKPRITSFCRYWLVAATRRAGSASARRQRASAQREHAARGDDARIHAMSGDYPQAGATADAERRRPWYARRDALARHRLRPAADRPGAVGSRPACWRGRGRRSPRAGNPTQVARRSRARSRRCTHEDDGLAAVVVGLSAAPVRRAERADRRGRGAGRDSCARAIAGADRAAGRAAEQPRSREPAGAAEKDWRKRKPLLDAAAAAVILQDYLDAPRPRRDARILKTIEVVKRLLLRAVARPRRCRRVAGGGVVWLLASGAARTRATRTPSSSSRSRRAPAPPRSGGGWPTPASSATRTAFGSRSGAQRPGAAAAGRRVSVRSADDAARGRRQDRARRRLPAADHVSAKG